MKHYDLCKTDGTPSVIRYYTLNAMKECGFSDSSIRIYANKKINANDFTQITEKAIADCNRIYEKKCEREQKDYQYRQTAVYKQFTCLKDIRFLMNRCVDEESYKTLKKAMAMIDSISHEAFAEDKDGNDIEDLIPTNRPEWKK